MPLYQLPVAATLAASAVTSFAVFLRTQPTEGKIKLTGGDDEHYDAFDVTTPEDIIDGDPIDEQGFWSRVRESILYEASWGFNVFDRCDSARRFSLCCSRSHSQ